MAKADVAVFENPDPNSAQKYLVRPGVIIVEKKNPTFNIVNYTDQDVAVVGLESHPKKVDKWSKNSSDRGPRVPVSVVDPGYGPHTYAVLVGGTLAHGNSSPMVIIDD